jgi:threonine/homoserine/homoserine lactone efflux protein
VHHDAEDDIREAKRRKLLKPEATKAREASRGPTHPRLFREGFVVNLLNPKTAIFFLAFLPRFVDMSRGHVASQIALLGLMFIALAASAAGQWLKKSRAWLRLERAVGGSLMIGLGVTAGACGRREEIADQRSASLIVRLAIGAATACAANRFRGREVGQF